MASTTDGAVVWMWVDSVGLLAFSSSRSLLGLMTSLLSFPFQPVTDSPAHYQLEVPALQPGQLFREQRYARTPCAGHARDVGAPEPARGAEGVVEAVQLSWMSRNGQGLSEGLGAPGAFIARWGT